MRKIIIPAIALGAAALALTAHQLTPANKTGGQNVRDCVGHDLRKTNTAKARTCLTGLGATARQINDLIKPIEDIQKAERECAPLGDAARKATDRGAATKLYERQAACYQGIGFHDLAANAKSGAHISSTMEAADGNVARSNLQVDALLRKLEARQLNH